MSFCPNCGKALEAGAGFCTNCGYSLNGRETAKENHRNEAKNVIEGFKLFFQGFNPSEGKLNGFLNSEKSESTIIFIIGIILLQGLMFLWKLSQVYNNMFDYSKSLLVKLIYNITEFTGERIPYLEFEEVLELQSGLTMIKSYINFNTGKIFGYGILLSGVGVAAIILGTYVASRLRGEGDSNLLKIIRVVGISLLPLLYGSLASILISYISEGAAAIVLLVFIMITIGSLYNNIDTYVISGSRGVISLSVIRSI